MCYDDDAASVPTPGVAAHRTAMAVSPQLAADKAATCRSCVGALLYYVQDRADAQFEV